jgi:hypothetical protein
LRVFEFVAGSPPELAKRQLAPSLRSNEAKQHFDKPKYGTVGQNSVDSQEGSQHRGR